MSQQNRACAAARRQNTILLAAASLLLAMPAMTARAAGPETAGATFAASLTTAGEFADTGTAQSVSISDDGRFVAFVSDAANLDPEAPAGVAEAYVKNLESGELTLASRAGGLDGEPANVPPPGEQPPTGIERALISGDGRYVLFTSRATNLAGDELPLAQEVNEEFFSTHVYRRDLVSGETLLVDRETGLDGAAHLLEAVGQAISADGRFVLFRAEAADLGDPGGAHESTNSGTIYLRDVETGETIAVSRASGEEGELANERSAHGAISADARHVAFDTFATNPGLGTEANEATQVYLRELQSPFATTMVSRSDPSAPDPDAQANGESFEPVFVGEPCRVGFTSEATNLVAAGGSLFQAYLRDECADAPSTTMVGLDEAGEPFTEAALLGASGDGRLALISGETFPIPRHLYVRDLVTAQTALVDRASGTAGAAADLAAEQGAISANGCRVAFSSPAANLTAEAPPSGGPSQQLQVFVRQLTPCHPTPEQPPVGGPGAPTRGSAQPPAATPPTVSILGLRRSDLRLGFSAAGTATVRLDRKGRRHWRRIAEFLLTATGPGSVGAALPTPAPGRYRLSIRLAEPASPVLRRLFTVPAR